MRLLALHIEVDTTRIGCGRWWLPDGLHVWLGNRGIHMFWSSPPHIEFDRLEDDQ